MSNIEWTNQTWNPLAGCTPVSAGCLNCYAAPMAMRLAAMGKADYTPRVEGAKLGTPYDSHTPEKTVHLAVRNNGRAVFTGDVRLLPHKLSDPLKWKKPRMIFVNSMSDLFHKEVPFEFIDRVFGVMANTRHHTYQILTKRPERMAEYMQSLLTPEGHLRAIHAADKHNMDHKLHGAILSLRTGKPFPNVWFGTSVENQQAADERIDHLRDIPAVVRFLSVEPLLGPLDLVTDEFFDWACGECGAFDVDTEVCTPDGVGTYECLECGYVGQGEDADSKSKIHWVIVGGESGPNPRPCNIDWIRSVVQQCKAAGVPVFVKQLGANPFDSTSEPICEFTGYQQWVSKASSWLGGISGGGIRYKRREKSACIDAAGRLCRIGADFMRARDENQFPVKAFELIKLRDPKGGDMSEWPADLQNMRQMPEVAP